MSTFSKAEYVSASQKIDFNEWTVRPLKWHTDGNRKIPSFLGSKVDMTLKEAWPYIESGEANCLFGYHKDFVVIDFDDREVLENCKRTGSLPTPILKVKTYKGEHWYYRQDGSIKKGISQKLIQGIDVRTGLSRNNIVLPGSWHPISNQPYTTIYENGESTDAPGLFSSELTGMLKFSFNPKDKVYKEGSRNNTLNERVYRAALVNDQKTIEQERQMAIESGLSEEEVEATIQSAMVGADKVETIYIKEFGIEHLKMLLKIMNLDMRYDLLSSQIQIKDLSQPDSEWKLVDRFLDAVLLTEISERFVTGVSSARPVYVDDARWRRLKNKYVADKQINPFLEWLEGLPEWDGKERIAEVFNTPMFLVKDKGVKGERVNYEWNKRVGELLIHGIVMRQLDPGCQFDYVPVLIGPQGCGKSRWVQAITGNKYFTESIDFTDGDTEFVRSLMGAVVGEVSETLAASRKDVEHIKRLVAREVDHYRPLYANSPEPLPRRCVMVATHNGGYNGVLPPDDTGYRRWLPIYCVNSPTNEQGTQVDWNNHWWIENREQVFAEALYNCNKGDVCLYLDEKMAEVQDRMCRGLVYSPNPELDDVLEELIEKVLKIDPKTSRKLPGVKAFTISQLIYMAKEEEMNNGVGVSRWNVGNKAIAIRLRAMGYQYYGRADGKRALLWYKMA